MKFLRGSATTEIINATTIHKKSAEAKHRPFKPDVAELLKSAGRDATSGWSPQLEDYGAPDQFRADVENALATDFADIKTAEDLAKVMGDHARGLSDALDGEKAAAEEKRATSSFTRRGTNTGGSKKELLAKVWLKWSTIVFSFLFYFI